MNMDLMVPDFQKLPPRTEAQVVARARPGETWAQARARLEANNYALPPIHYYNHPGAEHTVSGPFDECQDLDGGRINWQPGELEQRYFCQRVTSWQITGTRLSTSL